MIDIISSISNSPSFSMLFSSLIPLQQAVQNLVLMLDEMSHWKLIMCSHVPARTNTDI